MNDLENTVLSQRSQSQKTPYCRLLFVWNTQNRTVPVDTDSRLLGARARARGTQTEMGSSADGSVITFWGDDSGPNLIVLMVAQL